MVLAYATVPLLRFRRCWLAGLNANRLVTQEMDLEGSTFTRAVRLIGAHIAGLLSCRGVNITHADEDRRAFVADRVKVGDHVFLDDRLTANGEVWLPDAVITGSLSWRAPDPPTRGWLNN